MTRGRVKGVQLVPVRGYAVYPTVRPWGIFNPQDEGVRYIFL
jgi:hypothetical protein